MYLFMHWLDWFCQNNRAMKLKELLQKVLSTAPDSALTDAERAMFDRIVARFAEKTEVLSAVGMKEGLGEDAELFIVKSC